MLPILINLVLSLSACGGQSDFSNCHLRPTQVFNLSDAHWLPPITLDLSAKPIRKLHLVRPDLIAYPISYAVYC